MTPRERHDEATHNILTNGRGEVMVVRLAGGPLPESLVLRGTTLFEKGPGALEREAGAINPRLVRKLRKARRVLFVIVDQAPERIRESAILSVA